MTTHKIYFGTKMIIFKLHCLQRQGIFGFSRTRVGHLKALKIVEVNILIFFLFVFRLKLVGSP